MTEEVHGTSPSSVVAAALDAARAWYESHRGKGGNVNTNVMTSGMAVAELLRSRFPLTPENITSEKKSQVKGLSGTLAKKVLARYGEHRKFTSEGGRTSRGTLEIATRLADALTGALGSYAPDETARAEVADALQEYFVACVQADYFNKKRLEVDFDRAKPVSHTVADILAAAKARPDQPAGTVAQHLVGAKLELRFPSMSIGRDQANAADEQTDRQGDFQLGTTAFHVTVAPMAKLADRARENLLQGFRPLVLVPEASVAFARGLFESEGLGDSVGVMSIESFVGSSIEEMACFDDGEIERWVARLVRQYNDRITSCESDQSLKIEEPLWMTTLLDSDCAEPAEDCPPEP